MNVCVYTIYKYVIYKYTTEHEDICLSVNEIFNYKHRIIREKG